MNKRIAAGGGDAFSSFLIDRRKSLLIVTILVLVVIVYGFSFLSFVGNYRIFFAEDSDYLKAYDNFNEEYFTSDTGLTFIVVAKDGDLYTHKSIETLSNLTNLGWEIPYSIKVESIVNYPYMSMNGDELTIDGLALKEEVLSEKKLNEIRIKVNREDMLVNRLVNPSGALMIVNIGIQYDQGGQSEVSEIIDAAREIIAQQIQLNSNVDIYLFGTVMTDWALTDATINDGITLLPLLFVVSLLICFLMTRSVALLASVIIVIVASIVSCLGLAGWLGYSLNVLSSMAILLTTILALANMIHIGVVYFRELHQLGDKVQAMRASIYSNWRAVCIMSLTTIVGFSSLNFIEADGYRELGQISTLGIFTSLILSLTLFPSILLWLSSAKSKKGLMASPIPGLISDFALKYRVILLVLFSAITFIVTPFVFQNEYNADPMNFFDKESDFGQSVTVLRKHMEAMSVTSYSFDSQVENGIHDPIFLNKVDQFTQWYRQQPEVTHIYSYVNVIKNLNRNMTSGSSSEYKIPGSTALASQFFLLYEMSLGMGQDIRSLVNENKSATKVYVTTIQLSNKNRLLLEQRAQAWIRSNASTLAGPGFGLDLLFAHQNDSIFTSITKGSIYAVLAITFIIFLGLKSIKYSLISLIPNLIPPLIVYGLWGMFVGEVMESTMIAFSISLGIIIDDTVHILDKYKRARLNGLDPESAVRETMDKTALAIIFTTFTVGSGLFILSLSSFVPDATLGLIMAPTIFIALIFDLLMLPGLLVWFDKNIISDKIVGKVKLAD